MNEDELNKAVESEMMSYDAMESNQLKYMALSRYSDEFKADYDHEYRDVRGMVICGDKIPEIETFKTESDARTWAKKKIAQLFDEGNQDLCSVKIEWTEKTSVITFDCSQYREVKAQRRIAYKNSYRQKLINEENFKKRSSRWEQACIWCSQNGIRVQKEKDGSIGHNNRTTIVDKIVKADLVKKFNAEFPEFTISDDYLRTIGRVKG